MKFQITRSSEGATSKTSPFPGAQRGPESPAWPGEYTWFLELNSLDDLMALLDKSGGGLALFSPEEDEEHPVIEVLEDEECEE